MGYIKVFREKEINSSGEIAVIAVREGCSEAVKSAKKRFSIVIAPCENADIRLDYEKVEKIAEEVEKLNLYNEILNFPHGIVIHDGEKILFANKTALDFVGSVDLLNKKVLDFISEDYKNFIKMRIQKMLSKESVEPAVELFKFPDGRTAYLEINATPVKYRDKDAILLVLRDISATIDAKERLKRLERFFMNAKDVFFILDKKGRFLEFNPKLAEIFGRTQEELKGKNSGHLVYPEDYQKLKDFFRRVLTSGEARGEFRFLRKNEIFWLELHEWLAGKEVEGIAREITERKELEKALIESERKYREIFENSLDAIVVTDLKGNFLEVNKIFEEVMGIKREEIIGKNFSEFLSRETAEKIFEKYNKAFKDKKDLFGVLFEFNSPKKGFIYVEGNVKLLWMDGKIIGFLTNLRDVTRTVKLEAELERLNEVLRKIKEVHEILVRIEDKNSILQKIPEILADYNAKISKLPECKHSIPIKTAEKDFGYLCINLELNDEELGFFRSLAETMALAFNSIENREIKDKTLKKLSENILHIAEILDRIRNPLTAVAGYLEFISEDSFRKKAFEQIERINSYLKQLDLDWINSEKIFKDFKKSP